MNKVYAVVLWVCAAALLVWDPIPLLCDMLPAPHPMEQTPGTTQEDTGHISHHLQSRKYLISLSHVTVLAGLHTHTHTQTHKHYLLCCWQSSNKDNIICFMEAITKKKAFRPSWRAWHSGSLHPLQKKRKSDPPLQQHRVWRMKKKMKLYA